MGGRLGENLSGPAWLARSPFPLSPLELVVPEAEVPPTMCDTCGGGISLTTGVYVQCRHPVTFMANCKTAEEV